MTPQEDLALQARAPILAANIEAKNKEVAAKISHAYAEASRSLSNALGHTICAGLMMIERKEELPHGEFGPWLQKYCPEISWMTATRFMNASKSAVASVLGPETAKGEISHNVKFDGQPLHVILAADPITLTKEARDVQNQFRDFLAGKTQHQLLLEWRSAREDRAPRTRAPQLTPEEIESAHVRQAEDIAKQLIQDIEHFILKGPILQRLSDATRKALLDKGEEMNSLLRAATASARAARKKNAPGGYTRAQAAAAA